MLICLNSFQCKYLRPKTLESYFKVIVDVSTIFAFQLYIFIVFFREGEKPKNPMVELFYGRFLAVGVLEGIVPKR